MGEPAQAAELPLREKDEPLPRRAPKGTISREDIVQAVTRIVMSDGSGEASVHALAPDLGLAPVSLYPHVSSRDGVLDEAADRLQARDWRPEASARDWQAWAAEAASRLRDFLVSQLGGEQAGDGPLARQLAAYTTAEQFQEGLRYLLEGITSHASTSAEHGKQPEGHSHGGTGANAPGPGDLQPGLG